MTDGLPSQEPKPQKETGNPDNQSGECRDISAQASVSVTRPPTDVPQPPPNPNHPSDYGNTTRRSKPNWIEAGTFFLEIVGVVGLIFYCWVNYKEWRVFDSERITMETEFKTSQINVDRQLNEFRKDRILDERAWVFAYSIAWQTNGPDTNSVSIIVYAKNTGKTPAINTKIWVESDAGTNSDFIPTTDNPANPIMATTLLAPEQKFSSSLHPIEISRVFNSLSRGDKIYVWGTIWYDDIFGNHHWSQYCLESAPDLRDFRAVGKHNSCDDAQTSTSQTN